MGNEYPGNVPRIRRGATVVFESTFYDQNRNEASPSSAVVSISYPNPAMDGTRTTVDVDMSAPGGGNAYWSADWNSNVAGTGTVYFSVQGTTGSDSSVEDGQFVLTANPANTL